MEERWIVIPGWDKFQHYRDRNPNWVKSYVDQLDRDEYLALTFSERGLLENVRLLYARRNEMVRGDTASLTRALTQRVTEKQLQALVDAGYIQLSASKPVAKRSGSASPEKRREEKKPLTPYNERNQKPANADVVPGAQGPRSTNSALHVCPHCGIHKPGPVALAEHVDNVHYDLRP